MPQISGGPKGLNSLLESVYSNCISGGGKKSTCSAVAWQAAENAGWNKNKDGKWVKKNQETKKSMKNFWDGVI